jgi:hypothetical protein
MNSVLLLLGDVDNRKRLMLLVGVVDKDLVLFLEWDVEEDEELD